MTLDLAAIDLPDSHYCGCAPLTQLLCSHVNQLVISILAASFSSLLRLPNSLTRHSNDHLFHSCLIFWLFFFCVCYLASRGIWWRQGWCKVRGMNVWPVVGWVVGGCRRKKLYLTHLETESWYADLLHLKELYSKPDVTNCLFLFLSPAVKETSDSWCLKYFISINWWIKKRMHY